MSVGVVLVAAGQGTRLGADRPKALVPLHGSPVVAHAVLGVLAVPHVTALVVVAPPDHLRELVAAVRPAAGAGAATRVRVVPGGAERSASVALGLAALPDDVGIVLVHDAARALTPPAVFERVIAAVREGHPAVVPVLPVADTVKVVDPAGGTVQHTLERRLLRTVQTPQGFLRETLARAHAAAGPGEVTDDAGLVEAHGGRVHVVAGDPRSMKVTTPVDLRVAEVLAAAAATDRRPVLLVLGGLPGAGKTTLAREWAGRRRAAHVRVDTVEQALVRGGVAHDLGALGYTAAYELAADQLRVGLDVVADSVNPVEATRAAWRDVGWRAGARVVEVEVTCGDPGEHRRRVEGRAADIEGHRLPDWAAVDARDYEPWEGVALRVDTLHRDVSSTVRAVEEALR